MCIRDRRTYIAFGLLHAVAIGLIATRALGATPTTAAGITAALALWPIVLAVVLRRPHLRRLRTGIPLGEDRGLESASILMTILGACGVLSPGAPQLPRATGRSPADLAVAAIVVGLEALAAIALIRMTDHRRAIATIYALIAGAVALAAVWPAARTLGQHSLDLRVILRWLPAAIQIVIPAATLVLMRRTVVPTARASYRVAPPSR